MAQLNRSRDFGMSLILYLFTAFAWWFLAIGLGSYVALFAYTRIQELDNYSIWLILSQAGAIFLAIMAGGIAYSLVPTGVAQGVTRRELSAGFLMFAVVAPPLMALITIAGYTGEYFLLTALDSQQKLVGGLWAEVSGSVSDTLIDGLLTFPVYYVYTFVGMLTGVLIYRMAGQSTIPVIFVIAGGVITVNGLSDTNLVDAPLPIRLTFGLIADVDLQYKLLVVAVLLILYGYLVRRLLSDVAIRSHTA
ncbi:hypothetical protein [Haloglycomyces albus]|uniref:hypothetical protein n=1 Tax=Haloglycomyces albus TaxID=526067 RepID=UPI00046D6064|nr:hypothetical protein [Haloglycomyces albus]